MVTVARRPWLMVAALVLVLASGTVYAHRGATGIVKKRMDVMVSLGSAMKALTAMMRGKQAYGRGARQGAREDHRRARG